MAFCQFVELSHELIGLQAGTEETWVYPSQQMFFNALLRKGETQINLNYIFYPNFLKNILPIIQTIIQILLGWEFEEGSLAPEDMEHIIKIHNANNESAWQEVAFILITSVVTSPFPLKKTR